MNAQESAIEKLEAEGFRFVNWIPFQPDAEGGSEDPRNTAVMARRGSSRFGKEYREVEPDGTIH